MTALILALAEYLSRNLKAAVWVEGSFHLRSGLHESYGCNRTSLVRGVGAQRKSEKRRVDSFCSVIVKTADGFCPERSRTNAGIVPLQG